MVSLPEMCGTLGSSCMRWNKIIHTQPCIAQLYNNNKKKSTHFSNLVSNHQIAKGTLFPLALVGQRKQCQNEKWKARVGEAHHELPPPPSLIETTIQDFYRDFNAKNIENLKQLVSDNCVYQDFLFYTPYQGQDVINFWQNVMDAMGPNIKVAVESINENDNLMATVFWHLEWHKRKIPFTNGCRFFWFEEVEGRLIIIKITGLEELPLKPGELVLNVLKAIRTFFDSYPPMAAALLDSHAFQDGSTHEGSP